MFKLTRKNKPINSYIFCACGCGKTLLKYDWRYRERKFIAGHNIKPQYGKDNNKWNGGIRETEKYIYVCKPEHPFSNPKFPYIREHRLVYEHYLKILFDEDIYIPREIDIHHENNNGKDNSLINLTPLTKDEHKRIKRKTPEYYLKL